MTADQIMQKLSAAGACNTSAGVIVVDTQKFVRSFITALGEVERLEGDLAAARERYAALEARAQQS